MKLILLGLALITIASCTAETSDQTQSRKEAWAKHYAPGSVYDFKMEDGTRCIFIISGYGGGLSCDYKDDQ